MIKTLMIACGLFIASTLYSQVEPDFRQKGADKLILINNNIMDSVYAMYYVEVRKKFSIDDLRKLWTDIENEHGQFISLGESTQRLYKENYIVTITADFERSSITFQTAFNPGGEIVGFFITGIKPKKTDQSEVEQPEYLQEMEYPFSSDGLEFSGSLTIPNKDKPTAVVVLIHGSGPNDRDETIGPNKPFRDLAWGLAQFQIATLRFDKRTYTHSTDVMANYENFTIEEETIRDAVAAIKSLAELPEFRSLPIFMIGHSLGAFAGPRIAQASTELDGLIMMAGNSRPLQVLIWEQYNYIFGIDGISDEEKEFLKDLESQINNLDLLEEESELSEGMLPMNLTKSYWKDLLKYDPVTTARSLDIPIFIIQGVEDYQVTMDDFNGWKKGLSDKENVKLKSYPGLNHLFIEGEVGKKSVPSDYQIKGYVAHAVVSDIGFWIQEHSK